MGLSVAVFSQEKATKASIQKNAVIVNKDSVSNKNILSTHDKCNQCEVKVTGNKVEGLVYDCSKKPWETRIIVTDKVTGQQWQNTGATINSVPTIDNLPLGRTYHASVKSRFGQYNPIWTSECGMDFTLPNAISGTLNFRNNINQFCGNESIIVETHVSNETEHTWKFYKDNTLIKTLPVGNALSAIEDLQYLYNDWQVGYYFPPGNYKVELATSNAASSKLFTLKFNVLNLTGVQPQANIISKPESQEAHPIGNVMVSTICDNRNTDGPILRIIRDSNLNNCSFIDENITVSLQVLDLVNGNHQNPVIRTISTNGLQTIKIKDYFNTINFNHNDYYLINSKVFKLSDFSSNDCSANLNSKIKKQNSTPVRRQF